MKGCKNKQVYYRILVNYIMIFPDGAALRKTLKASITVILRRIRMIGLMEQCGCYFFYCLWNFVASVQLCRATHKTTPAPKMMKVIKMIKLVKVMLIMTLTLILKLSLESMWRMALCLHQRSYQCMCSESVSLWLI